MDNLQGAAACLYAVVVLEIRIGRVRFVVMEPGCRVQVAVGIIVENGRVLIARRPSYVPLRGHWEFPGGKLEPGETPEAAVTREIDEELGIRVIAVDRLPSIDHDYSHAAITLTPVVCRRLEGEPRAVHCSEFRWIALVELPTFTFPAANQPLLHRLMHSELQIDAAATTLFAPKAGD